MRFSGDFTAPGLEAVHIGGHTPGFTMYLHGPVLFACDYAFPPGAEMRLNPHGPQDATRARAQWVLRLIDERPLETVCGYNYVTDFETWRRDFSRAAA